MVYRVSENPVMQACICVSTGYDCADYALLKVIR